MIALHSLAPAPFAPSRFLMSETSIINEAATQAHVIMNSRFSADAHRAWQRRGVAAIYGMAPSEPAALIQMFAGRLPPKLKEEDSAIRSYVLIEEFAGLLDAYHDATGTRHSIFLGALFALDRFRTSFWDCPDISFFHGMFPWMNAGINAHDRNPCSPADVVLAKDSAAISVEQWEWEECLRGQKVFVSKSELPLVLKTRNSVEVEHAAQPAFDIEYGLRVSQDDKYPQLLRLDILPNNRAALIDENLWLTVKPIAIERGAAFLHGIKWWLENKANGHSFLKARAGAQATSNILAQLLSELL